MTFRENSEIQNGGSKLEDLMTSYNVTTSWLRKYVITPKTERRNASVLVAKRGVMVPGVPCVDHGNWGRETRHCKLFVTECGVLRRKFWQESCLIRLSLIQRCRSFSKGVGPRIILLESQPGKQSSRSKRSREITTEPIAVWVQSMKTLAQNKQSMTVCGYCGYYLERCSKANHIAIKLAKYENVFGLVAHWNHATCFLHSAKYVDLQSCKNKNNNVWIWRHIIVREN